MILDPQQLKVVESKEPVTVVIAGPGSGKTRVLVERIKWLVDGGASPSVMAVMTFTNAGAHELRERLGGIKLGYLGTLHGWCYRLLQRHGSAVGYREGGINLLTQEQSDEMLEQSATKMHWKGSTKALFEGKHPLALLAHKDQQFTMKQNNMINYDGVLRDALAVLKLRTAGEVRIIVSSSIPTFLFVDERQDSAEIDDEIYTEMGAPIEFHVGDPDQGIFSFRGASPRAFTHFARRHTPIILEWNYRSGVEICAVANLLIGHNTDRIKKDSVPARRFNCHVTMTTYGNCIMERIGIANRIPHLLNKGAGPSDIAVLCRTNEIAIQFRDSLLVAGVPVRRSKAIDSPLDWQHALNVLKLFNDPRNDIMAEWVLREIMNDPQGTGGTLKTFKKRALETGRWLVDVAADSSIFPGREGFDVASLPRWRVGKESCALIAEKMEQLPQSNPTLVDLIHSLYQANKLEQEEPSGVTVSTIHGAKGWEWSIVFLPAWEEGVIPQLKKDADLGEERRLAFVAITRAKSELHVSHAQERRGEWKTTNPAPSRFIAEAGIR